MARARAVLGIVVPPAPFVVPGVPLALAASGSAPKPR